MSEEALSRVRRVRASRERRAANILTRQLVMHIQHSVLGPIQPRQVDERKRKCSLMDFTPQLAKLNRQRRCLLRSKMEPVPPVHAENGTQLIFSRIDCVS